MSSKHRCAPPASDRREHTCVVASGRLAGWIAGWSVTVAQKKKQRKRRRSSAKAASRVKVRAGKKATKRKAVARRTRRKARQSNDVLNARGIEIVSMSAVRPKARSARVGAGAGDYTGVSPVEGADSESPRELLEEGNTLEAEAVSGVQNAPNADRSEVRTREVPEDDVPPEYLDPDRP